MDRRYIDVEIENLIIEGTKNERRDGETTQKTSHINAHKIEDSGKRKKERKIMHKLLFETNVNFCFSFHEWANAM